MDGWSAGSAEERKIDPGANVAPVMSLPKLRRDCPGEECLERLSTLSGESLCLSKQAWGKFDRGAHKSILTYT
jgi:hypothetical protein